LTSESAKEARGLEWRRKVDIGLLPGMTPKDRRLAAAAGAGNRTVRRTVMMWTALEALLAYGGPEASGWMRLDDATSDHGSSRVLVLKGRKSVTQGWSVPTLLIDASLNPDLIRPWWPDYAHGLDESAVWPHQRTRQDASRAYGKEHFGQSGTKNPDGIRLGKEHLRKAAAIANRAMMQAGKRGGLVIANKGVEEALPGVWQLPPGVDTAHFNAIAGVDVWGGIGSLVVIGSTNAPPSAVEELAEAVTGAYVPPLPGWYERHTVTRETTGGMVRAEAERHPHSIAEAIRWQIREGEVIQAVGRARGVNRTAENPVDVLILGDAVLPFPVEPVNVNDIEPSHSDMMMAAGGVALESPTHAATCYPDLWTPEAAKKAFQRCQSGTFPYNELPIGNCPPLITQWTYQLAGGRHRPATAWINRAVVPDPAAWLTARLGPLSRCQETP
jgi:putative DNA primase/helicase